jgi:hypothetical protein
MTRANRVDHERRLALLLGPVGPELTCEKCFEQLDRYVQLELADAQADQQVPGMRAHLGGCPACSEDHDSLKGFVTRQRAAIRLS